MTARSQCPFQTHQKALRCNNDRKWPIVLQKSKVAALRIFRENEKRETIADSHTLNRVTEVVSEFNARGSVPPHLYTKDAPTARRIFGYLCKTTFATQSANSRPEGYEAKSNPDPIMHATFGSELKA
jgi:hypothetical protein